MPAQMVVACLWGSVLYVGKSGDCGLFLARGGNTKKINFSKVASGSLFDKDGIFLADSTFSKNVNKEALGKFCQKDDFKESLEAIQTEIKEVGEALYVRLSVQEPVEKPYPVLIADLDKKEIGEEERGQKFQEAFKNSIDKIPKPKLKVEFFNNFLFRVKLEARRALSFSKPYVRKALFIILSPWLPRLPGALEDEASRKKKRIAEIALVLAAIFLISISVGFFNHSRKESKERFDATVASVESKLSEAENLEKINPAKAASLVTEAESELSKISSSKNPKVKNLKEKLAGLLTKINRIYNVETKLFSDLSLLKGKIDVKEIKMGASDLYAFDVNSGSVYKIPLEGAEPKIFVSEKEGSKNIAADENYLYLQTKDEILKVDQNEQEKRAAFSSPSWKNPIEAETFRDKFYLLDSGAKQVWRYFSAGSSLSGPQKYLTENFNGEATSFAIDGAVWIATGDSVSKFFDGKRQDFSIKNQPREISEIADIYTKEGFVNLYILDKGAGGVFVIEKQSGNYVALYQSDNLRGAKAIIVDESKKVVYFLAQNTVYSFKLQ